MFEAYTRNKYRSTGVIQWMLNNAWPSMIWHLFDWYLRPGGGFFGTQKACEPLHVMYSYDDRSVVVTNQHAAGFHDLALRVRPDSGRAHLDLARVLAALGDRAGPIAHLRLAVKSSDAASAALARQALGNIGAAVE